MLSDRGRVGFFGWGTDDVESLQAHSWMPANILMFLLEQDRRIFSFPCKLSIVAPSIKLELPLYVG
jgi:hypothetical protein